MNLSLNSSLGKGALISNTNFTRVLYYFEDDFQIPYLTFLRIEILTTGGLISPLSSAILFHINNFTMANTDNNSLGLEFEPLREFPEWDQIFNMQKDLQERLGYDFKRMTLAQVADFMMFNKHALEDEIGEMLDALGGIHDGIGNAVWKRWKAKRGIAETTTIDYLTQRDRAELMFEIVDMLHFFINFAIACGFTGTEIANGYMVKNQENHRRQDNNY